MMNYLDKIKFEVKKILKEKKVDLVIGYQKASHGFKSKPIFITQEEEVEKLVWNPTCYQNLPRFFKDNKKEKDEKKIGIIVKGCDSRALNVLFQENFIKKENLYIIGVSCENLGMVDINKIRDKNIKIDNIENIEFTEEKKIKIKLNNSEELKLEPQEILMDRCLECKTPYPVVYDILIGNKNKRFYNPSFKTVKELEEKPLEERWNFWKYHFERCIRCYACRSVCPMCYCDECVVDSITRGITPKTTAEEKAKRVKWIDRSPILSENIFYHLVRAIHLAGRCVDCAECERVCPVNIPLRLLNKKLEKEAYELFDYEVGYDPTQPSLISSFKENDPEDFIK